jgi:hypothetical protein
MGIAVNRPWNALVFCMGLLCLGAETEDPLSRITDPTDRQAIVDLAKLVKLDTADIEVEECGKMLPPGVHVPVVGNWKEFRVCVGEGEVRGLFVQKYDVVSTAAVAALVHLRELHLVNAGIVSIGGLDFLAQLEVLDLAGNDIKKIRGLKNLPSLESLVLYRNSIKNIEGLTALTGLRYLNLNENKIKAIGGLETLSSLRELYLGGNKIKKIEGLCSLGALRILTLHDNKIGKIENLGCLTSLKELYLGLNKLKSCQGLGDVGTLERVDLGSNKIKNLDGLEGLAHLEGLGLSGNKIKKASAALEDLFEKHGSLQSVALHKNPLSDEEKDALGKLPPAGLASFKRHSYKVKCKESVEVPNGKSYDFYMGKARELHDEGECGKACSYYYKAADEYAPEPYNENGKPEAVEAAIATAFCTLEVYKNAPAAIKQFILTGLDEEQEALVDIGLAEAFRRRGKLKSAAWKYSAYLEDHPDGKHADLAKHYQGELFKFLQTHDLQEASNARIRQPVQLIFFEFKTDEHGNRYL